MEEPYSQWEVTVKKATTVSERRMILVASYHEDLKFISASQGYVFVDKRGMQSEKISYVYLNEVNEEFPWTYWIPFEDFMGIRRVPKDYKKDEEIR